MTLIETFVKANPKRLRVCLDEVRKDLTRATPQARRLVFDGPASEHVGRFARDSTDVLVANAEFALPPHPTTYVELDQHALLATNGRPVDPATPSRLGFLITGNGERVHTFSGNDREAVMSPFVYIRSDLAGARVSDDMAPGEYETFRNALMLGETSLPREFRVGEEVRSFLDLWSVRLAFILDRPSFDLCFRENAGDLKMATAALLLLNQKRRFVENARPAHRATVRGRPVAYAAHSIVSLDLAPRGAGPSFSIGERQSPRRHEVSAHFVHYRLDENCEHDWHEVDEGDGKRRWHCSACDGIRVRREKYDRGDASRGYVSKEYAVTSSARR